MCRAATGPRSAIRQIRGSRSVVAGAAIWHARTGQKTNVAIDIIDALHYLHPTHFVQQQGRLINVGAEHVAVNGMFLCRDNRYVMIEEALPIRSC
jgi:hypothetical protein